jgi:hypothetical protein
VLVESPVPRLDRLLALLTFARLGLPVALDRLVGPATALKFLRVFLDTAAMTAALSPEPMSAGPLDLRKS